MASSERLRAALRLVGPDHITPVGRRIIEQVLDAEAQEEQDLDDLLERMRVLLTETANALKGSPPPSQIHDWSDLPEVAAAMRQRLLALEAAARTQLERDIWS